MKAGLVFSDAHGAGELFEAAKLNHDDNSLTALWNLLAGTPTYRHLVFLMTASSIYAIHRKRGFESGAGHTVVAIEQGLKKSFKTLL